MPYFENKKEPERALLVTVDTGAFDVASSQDELEELAKTAGAQVLGRMSQKRDAPDGATYVGAGRLEEIKNFCRANDIELLLMDGELSPSQLRNIEQETDVRVVDRTTLILDIFAARARTSEGNLQVELAQLRYALPRLTGKGASLSRLGGGIGTRGPGETKLESDRRHIRRKIYGLEEELKALEKRRNSMRARRKKDGIETVAIVGYTNAGKSTLMNALTQAGVLAEDKLFATLDPTARALALPDGRSVMLVDTVGLIRRLPHHLVKAFQSTLEEAVQADVILNVCDGSSPECAEHLLVTGQLLEELQCGGKPILNVVNKCDLVPDLMDLPVMGKTIPISALYGKGLELLLDEISNALPPTRRRVVVLLPFDQGGLAAEIRRDGIVNREVYTADGLELDCIIDFRLLERLKPFLIE